MYSAKDKQHEQPSKPVQVYTFTDEQIEREYGGFHADTLHLKVTFLNENKTYSDVRHATIQRTSLFVINTCHVASKYRSCHFVSMFCSVQNHLINSILRSLNYRAAPNDFKAVSARGVQKTEHSVRFRLFNNRTVRNFENLPFGYPQFVHEYPKSDEV
jgi:hypothetical protein